MAFFWIRGGLRFVILIGMGLNWFWDASIEGLPLLESTNHQLRITWVAIRDSDWYAICGRATIIGIHQMEITWQGITTNLWGDNRLEIT